MRHHGNALLIFAVAVATANAETRTFLDRGAFINATYALPGESLSIEFGKPPYPIGPVVPGANLEFGPSVTAYNVTFQARYLMASSGGILTTSGAALYSMEGTGPLLMFFDVPVRAFGADYGSVRGHVFPSFTAELTLDSGERFTFESPANPQSTFFGFILDSPIRSMAFSDGGGLYSAGAYFHAEMIKDLFLVMEVPEPGALTLLVLGTASWAFCAKRRSQSPSGGAIHAIGAGRP